MAKHPFSSFFISQTSQNDKFSEFSASSLDQQPWPWPCHGPTCANQAPSPSNPESEAHIPKETSGPSAREFGPKASGDEMA